MATPKKKIALNHEKLTVHGEVFFPKMSAPDQFGKLSCNVIVDEAQKEKIEACVKRCEKAFEDLEAWEKKGNRQKRSPYPVVVQHTDKDGEPIEGQYLFKNSAQPETWDGSPYVIKVLDRATRKALTGKDKDIWNGSIVNVGVVPSVWYSPSLGFGVGFKPVAVEVVKRVSGGGGVTAASFGFDGYDEEEVDSSNGPTPDGPEEDDDISLEPRKFDDDIPF